MKAMIFAAGLGTRLRPLTDSMPKALVPVGGIPMLQRVIVKLKAAGISGFVVNVHHFARQIEDFLAENGNFGVSVEISRELERPLETGGGIRKAEPYLGGGRFLVHNVDMLSDLDVRAFIAADRPSSLATLLVTDSDEADRYLLFDGDMRLAGWMNASTGEVRSPYSGLDPDSCRKFAFAGIHILSHKVFSLFGKLGFGERFSIVDFYLRAAADYPVYGAVQPGLGLIDVGKPESLSVAGDFLMRCGDVSLQDPDEYDDDEQAGRQ